MIPHSYSFDIYVLLPFFILYAGISWATVFTIKKSTVIFAQGLLIWYSIIFLLLFYHLILRQ